MMPSCSLCFEKKSVTLLDAKFHLYRCAACDHTFTVKSKEFQEVYEEAYFLEKHKNWFANPHTSLFDFIYKTLAAQKPAPDIKVFDIGCGNGNLLKFLRQRHKTAELWGIDSLKNELEGVHFVHGDLYKDILNEKFDAVISLMVIEHVDDPLTFTELLNRYLKPGGLLILSTNNNHGLIYKIARALYRVGWRTAFDRLYSDHHLQHFGNASLRLLLERYGFQVIQLKNHNYPLRAVDTPPANPLVKRIYKAAVAVMFVLSDIFGNGFLQTYVCQKTREVSGQAGMRNQALSPASSVLGS